MTDESHQPPQHIIPPDNIVEQTLERAAQKVADGATVPLGTPIMRRTEAFVALAILIIINTANLVVALQGRNHTQGNSEDHRIVCELVVATVPHDIQDPDIAKILARCIK